MFIIYMINFNWHYTEVMKMNKKIKKIIGLTAITATGMHIMNRIVDYTAGLKNLLTTDKGEIYDWSNGKIFYQKYGKGTPILLIHDLNPSSSAVEWNKVIHKLEKNHTVYTLDLLGCGRSDKPGITYTNFLYVQLINNFIRDIIKEEVNIIATGLSGSCAVMAQAMNPDSFRKIILVNPTSLSNLKVIPEKNNRFIKRILEVPVLGTFLYNVTMHERKIHDMFEQKFFFKKSLISTKMEDYYFESAHKEKSTGKYLLASIQGNFMNIDISNALKKAENICIISSRERTNGVTITEEYLHKNKEIEVSYISNSKYLPQLEVPEKFFEIVKMLLEED